MSIFSLIALFITIAALASYVNHKYLHLPTTIGLMVVGLIMSLGIIGLNRLGLDFESSAGRILGSVDFGETLMNGMLSFLLFAGALKVNLNDLAERGAVVGTLATAGVVITTFLVGTALYLLVDLLEVALPYAYCLVFGALIAPTDPVSVLGILKSIKAPKSLETKITGESLFNDGVGVVVFIVMLGIASRGGEASVGSVAWLFVQEALGGAVFGILLGYLAYRLLKNVDEHAVEVLLTLALVCGSYALAMYLHISGPITVVVAGLLIGNYGRRLAMSERTRDHLDKFWELIDEILNAVLFIWIGLEMIVLAFPTERLVIGLVAIPVVLFARFISVWSLLGVLRRFRRRFRRNATLILTWGGLRGGISIALALSLAAGPNRDIIVTTTYIVVVFSILVQGLTVKPLIQRSSEG